MKRLILVVAIALSLALVVPSIASAHYLHLADARSALIGGNGDNDIAVLTGFGYGFYWSSYTRTADNHGIYQSIVYGANNYCRATFYVYYPNSSYTIYDRRTYNACYA